MAQKKIHCPKVRPLLIQAKTKTASCGGWHQNQHQYAVEEDSFMA
jgi:hypothetical protein